LTGELDAAIQRPPRWRIAVSLVLALGGVAVIAYFLYTTRLADVQHALGQLLAWIPLLLAIEGGRILVESAGTRLLYGLPRDQLPTSLLVRSHVVGYGLAFYMPAGRAAAETVKATMLAKCSTPARAAAVAAANQSLALLGLAVAAIVCAIGAAMTEGSSALVGPLVIVAGVTGGLGVVIRVATLRLRGKVVRRFAPKIATLVDEVRGEIPHWFPVAPFAMFLASRALQLLGIAVVVYAIVGDVSAVGALAANGVGLVGASLGDLVPGQLGATDATFAVSAGTVGLTREAAISIALVIHLVQMSWLGIALLMELALRMLARPAVQGSRVT
jgi:hypothetical protein